MRANQLFGRDQTHDQIIDKRENFMVNLRKTKKKKDFMMTWMKVNEESIKSDTEITLDDAL